MSQFLNDALEAHRQGRLDEAIRLYKISLKDNGDDQIALYGLGVTLLSRGDLTGLEFARKALMMSPREGFDVDSAADSIVRALFNHRYYDHLKELLDDLEHALIDVKKSAEIRKKISVPAYLESTIFDTRLSRRLKRYAPIESEHYVYAIDIVGGCNLRCPSCPVSYVKELPKGLMKTDQFEAILDKVRNESPDPNPEIWLFNWSEPMLHPQIGEFISIAKERGFFTFISTNLNISQRVSDLIKAQPDRIKISISSLKQEIYSKTHVRGDIAQVVCNMKTLSKLKNECGAKTEIWLGHHLYRNTVGETESVKALASELGFKYGPSNAIIAPIERVMAMLSEDASNIPEVRDQLLYDPLKIQAYMRARRSGAYDCELRFNMTSIRYDGTLDLCCATTQKIHPLKDVAFLEYSHQEIEALKYENPFCTNCMKCGLSLSVLDQ